MNEERIRERVVRSVDGTNQNLQGEPTLAEKIIRHDVSQSSCMARRKLVPLLAAAILTVVVTAVALLSRQSAVGRYGTWIYENSCLMYQGAEEKAPRTVLEDVTILAMDEDLITNTLYYISRESDGMHLHNITSDGFSHGDGRMINAKYQVLDLKVSSPNAYILANTSTGSGQLYRLDTFTDALAKDEPLETEGWENQGITAFAVDANSIYAYCAESGKLAVLSAYDRKLKYEPSTIFGLSCLEVGYQENGMEYVFAFSNQSPARLLLVNVKTGEKMDTGETVASADVHLDRDENTLYLISEGEGRMKPLRIRSLSGKQTLHDLTIVNGFILEDAYLRKGIELFNEKYPDVEVILREVEDDRTIATELMAGEDGIDLFLYRSIAEVVPGAMLLKNGAIADIKTIPEVQASLPAYREIWNPVVAHGKMYGWPIHRFLFLWKVNPAIAGKIGWEVPKDQWTIGDFEQLVDLAITWNESHEEQITLLCNETNYLLKQYESTHIDPYAGTVDLMTEEYLHLLRLQKKMADHHLLLPYQEMDQSLKTHASLLPSNTLFRADHYLISEEDIILPPVPSLEDPYPYLCQEYDLYMNENTPYPEETAWMMACLTSVEAATQRYYENTGQWLRDQPLSSGTDPMFFNEIPPDTELKYNYALEHLTRLQDAQTYDGRPYQDWLELLDAMLSGTVTPEAYAGTMQERVEMALGE